MLTSDCEGIVLAVMDYRESDKLLTLFTRDHGKLKGIARGAKRSSRRFGGTLELFARLQLRLTMREGLSTVESADVISIHPKIRKDLMKIGYAGYACELTDGLLPEAMSSPRLYRLLSAFLEHLEHNAADASDRRFFEINLLNITGYRPTLQHCFSCGIGLDAGRDAFYAASGGGVVCERCGHGGRRISARALELLELSMKSGRFGVVRFPKESLYEAGCLLDSAILAHIGRQLKSVGFLRELEEK